MLCAPEVPEAAVPVVTVTAPEGAVPEAPPAPVVIVMLPPVVEAPAAAPPVMLMAPPFPVVVPAELWRTRFTPFPVEEGTDGMMFRLVPAAVDKVVRSPELVPPFKAKTPVALAKVAFEPLRAIVPEVLPRDRLTLLAVPTDMVPEAAWIAAEAPKFKVVVEVAASVAAVVRVASEEAVIVVAFVVSVPEAGFKAMLPEAPEAIVSAPESVMVFVVKVSVPIFELVAKVPTPALVTDQLGEFKASASLAVVEPIVMLSANEPVPIAMVSRRALPMLIWPLLDEEVPTSRVMLPAVPAEALPVVRAMAPVPVVPDPV